MCQHTPQEFLHNLWHDAVHSTDMNADAETTIRQTLFPYLRLMLNRLTCGHFRYGPLGQKKAQFDRVSDMHELLEDYEKTGNLECLVDVSNLAFCEFVEGEHPFAHFAAKQDRAHTRRK